MSDPILIIVLVVLAAILLWLRRRHRHWHCDEAIRADKPDNSVPCWIPMQKWEYKVFASHLDPAELVVLLDESGSEGWELVTLVAVIDHLPLEVIEPAAAAQALDTDEGAEVVPMQTFRYLFKRPLTKRH